MLLIFGIRGNVNSPCGAMGGSDFEVSGGGGGGGICMSLIVLVMAFDRMDSNPELVLGILVCFGWVFRARSCRPWLEGRLTMFIKTVSSVRSSGQISSCHRHLLLQVDSCMMSQLLSSDFLCHTEGHATGL